MIQDCIGNIEIRYRPISTLDRHWSYDHTYTLIPSESIAHNPSINIEYEFHMLNSTRQRGSGRCRGGGVSIVNTDILTLTLLTPSLPNRLGPRVIISELSFPTWRTRHMVTHRHNSSDRLAIQGHNYKFCTRTERGTYGSTLTTTLTPTQCHSYPNPLDTLSGCGE